MTQPVHGLHPSMGCQNRLVHWAGCVGRAPVTGPLPKGSLRIRNDLENGATRPQAHSFPTIPHATGGGGGGDYQRS